MSSRIDYNTIFDNFMGSAKGSAIQDIYNIIPTLSAEQIKILNSLEMFAVKYNLPEVRSFVECYKKDKGNNRNLGFVNSMNVQNLLRAYTTDELIRGIKIQAQNTNTNGGI